MIKKRIKLGDLLLQKGLITSEELIKALSKQQKLKEEGVQKQFGEILIELGFIKEKQILEALAEQLKVPFVDLYGENIDYDLLLSYPVNLIESKYIVPFKQDDYYVYVATSDPLDYDSLELFEKYSSKPVKVFISLKKDISVIIERLKLYIHLQELINKVKEELKTGGSKNLSAIDELLDLIIKKAISMRVTDLHIEPLKYNFNVRGRIDGVLSELFSFEKVIYYPLVSKIKLLASMDISEKRRPQDGRFSKRFDNVNYDFRVSTAPTIFGESVVLRILDQGKILFKISDLGMSEYNINRFDKLIHMPYGMFFVTGPTGSGKTTTLYAALNEIKSIDKKIITIEDPVEYEIPLIQQIPVNTKIDLTFGMILRSVLRQDPDIIMIGEVRDKETLNAAIEASLTGHLVLATLHTNDSISAVTRMLEMGAENYMIADALNGVTAQRLIRTICPYCKEEYVPPKSELEFIKPYLNNENILFYRGAGCKKCNFTGYLGREMISEVLIVNEEISHLISLNKDKIDIYNLAKNRGFVSMVEDGVEKIRKGVTTVEEILRVVKIDVL